MDAFPPPAKAEGQGRALSYQDQLGQYDTKRAASAKAAAANQPFTDESRKSLPGYQQYTGGGAGTVTGVGSKADFQGAIDSGQASKPGLTFNGKPADAAAIAKQAETELGLTSQQLSAAVGKMTDQEYQDFLIAGVIPPWMDAPGAARGQAGASKGSAGGWGSPYYASASTYDPESMGRGVQNTQASQLSTVGKVASFI